MSMDIFEDDVIPEVVPLVPNPMPLPPKEISFESIIKMNRRDRRRIGKFNKTKFPSEINMKIITPPKETQALK